MLFTLDIGNTNIKTALFDGPEMVHYWRLSTTRKYTSDEMGVMMTQLFEHERLRHEQVTGIDIKYENPRELGSDRICNAVAAYTLYGGPCVYIDFGTATTFGALDEKGGFLGGCICPGIKLTSEALVSGTAKLPHFELMMPDRVIGKTTIANLQSGVINGYVGQVIYLVNEIRREMGKPEAKVIATGGMARLIAPKSGVIDHIDGLLTLKGLRLIYEKNQAKA